MKHYVLKTKDGRYLRSEGFGYVASEKRQATSFNRINMPAEIGICRFQEARDYKDSRYLGIDGETVLTLENDALDSIWHW